MILMIQSRSTPGKYFARQGLSLQGHVDFESNFYQQLLLQCKDILDLND